MSFAADRVQYSFLTFHGRAAVQVFSRAAAGGCTDDRDGCVAEPLVCFSAPAQGAGTVFEAKHDRLFPQCRGATLESDKFWTFHHCGAVRPPQRSSGCIPNFSLSTTSHLAVQLRDARATRGFHDSFFLSHDTRFSFCDARLRA